MRYVLELFNSFPQEPSKAEWFLHSSISLAYQNSNFEGEGRSYAWTPAPMGPALKPDFPKVIKSLRLAELGDTLIESDQK